MWFRWPQLHLHHHYVRDELTSAPRTPPTFVPNLGPEVLAEIRQLRGRLDLATRLLEDAIMDINDIKAAIAAENTVVGSAVVLLNGLVQQITDLKKSTTDEATSKAIQDLVDNTKSQMASLAAAVATGTPQPVSGAPGVTETSAKSAADAAVANNPFTDNPSGTTSTQVAADATSPADTTDRHPGNATPPPVTGDSGFSTTAPNPMNTNVDPTALPSAQTPT
jgi:hypothetical protein